MAKESTVGQKFRLFAAGLIALGIGLVAALLLAEGVVRVVFDEAVQPRFVIDSGYGVRANKPSTETRHYVPGDYDIHITTNSSGMRGRGEYPLARVRGRARILVLGDSFPFGYGVEDDEVVSAQLEAIRNESFSSQPVEVLNLAVSGFGQAEELVTYENFAKGYQPDVVIWFYFSNDIGNNMVSNLYAVGSGGKVFRTNERFLPGTQIQGAMMSFAPLRWLFEHSEAWNFFRNRLSGVIQQSLIRNQGLDGYDDTNAAGIELTRGLLREIAKVARRDGAAAVLVVIPTRVGKSNFPMSSSEVSEMGVSLIDARTFLVSEHYYDTDSHLRPSGHRLLAEQLARIPELQGWLLRATGRNVN